MTPPAFDTVQTLPGLLAAQAARRPHAVAIRVKRLGIWREIDWAAFADDVRDVALGLEGLGVGRGDSVAIFAANGPRLIGTDLAVQALRAVSVVMQPVQAADELAETLAAARAGIIVCGDQQHVDNVLAVRDRVPRYSKLVVFDAKGLHAPEYRDEPIVLFDDLRARGREQHASRPGRYGELLAAVEPDDASIVSFSAGTTGFPRGVLLSQRGQVAMARLLAQRVDAGPGDRAFSLLPLGHATSRVFDVALPLLTGASVNFPESPETIESDLAELSPTLLVAPPRFYARIRATVELRAARATPFKRMAYRAGMRQLERALRARLDGHRAASSQRAGMALVGRWVRDKAGLGDVRYAAVTCAPASRDLLDWYWRLCLPLHELYGQAEAGGVAFAQRGLEDAGTAGVALGEGIEARVAADGELQLRTPGLLVGRFGEQGTGLLDGWLPTGDLAELDPTGRLLVRDRRSSVVSTAGGDMVFTGEVAAALERSPYVSTAVVVGDGRPFVSALLELELDAVAGWAKAHEKPVTTYAALAADEDVRQLIGEEVEVANRELAETSRVMAFAITRQPLHDERTASGTVQQDAVIERHQALLTELYASHAAPAVA